MSRNSGPETRGEKSSRLPNLPKESVALQFGVQITSRGRRSNSLKRMEDGRKTTLRTRGSRRFPNSKKKTSGRTVNTEVWFRTQDRKKSKRGKEAKRTARSLFLWLHQPVHLQVAGLCTESYRERVTWPRRSFFLISGHAGPCSSFPIKGYSRYRKKRQEYNSVRRITPTSIETHIAIACLRLSRCTMMSALFTTSFQQFVSPGLARFGQPLWLLAFFLLSFESPGAPSPFSLPESWRRGWDQTQRRTN